MPIGASNRYLQRSLPQHQQGLPAKQLVGARQAVFALVESNLVMVFVMLLLAWRFLRLFDRAWLVSD
jgi:hypothetical protein